MNWTLACAACGIITAIAAYGAPSGSIEWAANFVATVINVAAMFICAAVDDVRVLLKRKGEAA